MNNRAIFVTMGNVNSKSIVAEGVPVVILVASVVPLLAVVITNSLENKS
jgi:hypothetical protein